MLANRFRGRGVEYEELFSAACLGLLKAADGFDSTRGLMFSTYAVPVILGEIKLIFRQGGAVKVSRSLKELSLKASRLQSELSAEAGDDSPHLSAIAARLGVSLEDAAEALCAAQPPVSLTMWDSGGDEISSQFDIPVEPAEVRLTESLSLRQSLERLPEADRRLLQLRYWQGKTQSETGKLLGMSQVQVSRREKKLLAELRQELAN